MRGIPDLALVLAAAIIGLALILFRSEIAASWRESIRGSSESTSPRSSAGSAQRRQSSNAESWVGDLRWWWRAWRFWIKSALVIAGLVVVFMVLKDPGWMWVQRAGTPDKKGIEATTFTVELDARTPGFTKYDFFIPDGSTVMFTAGGVIVADPVVGKTGPSGANWLPKDVPNGHEFLAPNCRMFSLMTRVGENLYNINQGTTIHFKEGGMLWLAINERWKDKYWADNSGVFIVQVTVVGGRLRSSNTSVRTTGSELDTAQSKGGGN